MDGFPSAPTLAVRLAVFASHALIFGLVPIFLLVLRPALAGAGVDADARRRAARRAETLMLGALVAALAGAAYVLVVQASEAADLAGEPLGGSAFRLVVATQFGMWHVARFPLCLALAVLVAGKVGSAALAEPGPTSLWWGLWAGLAGLLLASITMAGHAAGSDLSAVAVPNDIVHLASGATWLTGVAALLWLMPPLWRDLDEVSRTRVMAPAVDRFARVAFWSIVVVAVTGFVNSLTYLGGFGNLFSSEYGGTLAVKVCVFVCIVGLGAVNHFVMRPKLVRASRDGRAAREGAILRRSVALEVVLAVGVLGATAVLVGLPPPR